MAENSCSEWVRDICCIIIIVILLDSLFLFILWAVVIGVDYHVVGASLTEFNLTSDNMLPHNLRLNVTLMNPTTKIVLHRRIEVTAYYCDQQFGVTNFFAPFRQVPKNTTLLHPVFHGESRLFLDIPKNTTLRPTVLLKLHVHPKYKIGSLKIGARSDDLNCQLMVPLVSSVGSSATTFKSTKCVGPPLPEFNGR
ncbi:PREDICTED: NDR1/HIN1-Like protein 3-like [Nelumbo nucifera]|uniref:NDR1/HIN1-Like protein 3-like n=2 Tax=Nelumbo nucifera TaxID=4432 RepID=A0A1U7ZJF5_NELNU|nr:PREDICTED: NDR1/HIN1-Like protein 3-like [Nelumbo nucifera]DAD48402.1 TPA_asm: hypothetical protein HUJ06_018339 [Nelumbo nucifera]